MNQNEGNRRRQVLVVDDEYVNRQMLGFILDAQYEVIYAENGVEAMNILREKRDDISLIMLDILMPKMDGYEFLKIRQQDEKLQLIPVIVLTSEVDSELKTLRLGASDFITKPYDMPEVILARVERLVELTENRRVIQSAERDRLTGLYTKQFFYEYVQQREYFFPGRQMDIGALNIEKFHLVNEIFGREFGDKVLTIVAEVIQDFLNEHGGIACRSDADWFYIFFEHQNDYDSVVSYLQERIDYRITEIQIRLRLGVYTDQDHSVEIERRCDQAKIACDTLKDVYTRSVAFYDMKIHKDSLLSMRLINEVDMAILDGQLQVYYQPKFDITGEKPVLKSAEALVRWLHPDLGMISPGAFIPLFEKNGLIQKVDYHVWREAGAQVRAWRDKYGVSIPVSVNISRIDLYDPMLEAKLTGILDEFNLSSDEYYLEITESAYVGDQDHIVETVAHLQRLGFHIEMDDFGSGYSSLNMLTSLPVDVLKMDMKLVRNIHTDERSLHLARAVVEIAHNMHMSVVAEGVEEEEQCRLLKEVGCDVVQGWYFSKPVPVMDFENFIR